MDMLKQADIDYLAVAVLVIAGLLSSGCSPSKTHLEEIKERGVINVVTRNGPTTYYIGKDDKTGFEYELASRFAKFLGVKINLIIAKNTAEIVEIIRDNRADFAAAALIKTSDEQSNLIYGPSYQWVVQQLVYRNGQRRPSSLHDISPGRLDVADGTIRSLHLKQLMNEYPDLEWHVHQDKDNHELLEMLQNREILYTVADSTELTLARQYYPEIRAAFNVSPPQPLAWAFRKSGDRSLLKAIWRFHEEISNNGELASLIEQFYEPVGFFDYVDSRKFVERITDRLPKYQPIFDQAAKVHDLDWRLLAALSYQESHWNAVARSPTGVRGMMMLTLVTAKSIGVKNRLDPEQSILGGAKYLKQLINRLPDRITEPDRTWFALAAYNVGFGHLEDARILTQKQGGDPDSWKDVKERLPLLSRKKWYKQTKFGYARGIEPVRFVENIRKYYYTLIQLTQPETHPREQLVETIIVDSPVL